MGGGTAVQESSHTEDELLGEVVDVSDVEEEVEEEDAEVEVASVVEAVVELDVVEDVVDVVLCTSLSHTIGHNHNVHLKSQRVRSKPIWFLRRTGF